MNELALKLYTFVDGVNDTPFPSSTSQAVLTGWQYNAKRMGGAPSITGGTIIHEDCLDDDWSEDVYVEYKGEKFFAPHKPTSSYSSQSVMYDHKIDFFSERAVLDSVYFYDVVSEEDSGGKPISNNTKFTFFGTISEFIVRLNASMARSNTGYTVVLDEGQENSDLEKQVKFNEKYISEALQEGFKTYGIPYYFVGKVCHYGVGQSSILDNMVFEYGRNKSLISMTKTNANTKIVNRITGLGSKDNIPYYYPNSCEEGVVGVDNIESSTITAVDVIDGNLFTKKIPRGDTLTYSENARFAIDIPSFYVGDESYSNGQKIEVTRGLDNLSLNIPFEVPFNNVSDFTMKIDVDEQWYARHSSTPIITPTPSGNMTYEQQGNTFFIHLEAISKGEYQLKIAFNIATSQYIAFDISADGETQGWKSYTTEGVFQNLTDIGLRLQGTASIGDRFQQVITRVIPPQSNLMPPIYRESGGDERFYNATNNTYINPDTGEYYVFPKPYRSGKPKEYIHDEKDIKPTIVGIVNANDEPIDQVIKFAFDENDGDELDENGNYVHPHFFALLHRMDGEYGFNLFEQAIEEEEMSLSMTSGSLGGCEFIIGVGEENQKNTVQIELDANLQPVLDEDGHPVLKRDDNGDVLCGLSGRQAKQVPQDWQNDTKNNEVWVALKKDATTYNVVMPNATYNYKPQETDTDNFVLLHIDLPEAYILAAEKALEDALIAYMYEANFEHWNFSIDFSRIYFKENTSVANALDENKRIKIKYNGTIYERYISSYSYKTSPGERLPNISVELVEELQSASNPIDSAISEVTNLIEIQANAMIGYQQVARLARAALPSQQVLNAGNKTLPIYFDGTQAKTIEGLDVPENIHSEKNIQADGGVSAQGIADMSLGDVVGDGTVKSVQVGNGAPVEPDGYGNVQLPAYPSALSQLTQDAMHRTVTDVEKTSWDSKLGTTDVVTFANLDVDEAESQGKIPTAKGVAILKDRIGVETLDEYDPDKVDGYRRGDCVKVTVNGIATGYRFRLATPQGTPMVGRVDKVNFKTLATPLNIVNIENILV